MLNRVGLGWAAVALSNGAAAGAWAGNAEAGDDAVVAAPRIVDSLTSKDIVLDRPGRVATRPASARRDPAIDLNVAFGFGSVDLLAQGQAQLDELAAALGHRLLAEASFLLAGHTDRVGDADFNLRLSLGRAETVRRYLIDAHGIAAQRLQTIGFGFARLLDPAHPAAAVNRRVEVRRLVGAIASPRPGPASAAARPGGRIVPTPR
jgi:outer membrane protein OmpA-like peptidoglycan-associated protein